MLMADYVAQTTAGIEYIPKGVRWISQSRDYKIDKSAGNFITNKFIPANMAMRGGQYFWWASTAASQVFTQELPFFGDSFSCHWATGGDSDYANPVVTLNGSALSGFTNTYNGTGVDGVTSAGVVSETGNADVDNVVNFKAGTGTLGANTLKVSITSNAANGWAYNRSFSVATPIHTSSHYQTFETPFQHELVGGDRNMEQTNLVVTPDGKTWDEVTRDVSYIGNTVLDLTATSGDNANSVPAILDECRGNAVAQRYIDRGWKDSWTLAYDRVICLKDGEYRVDVHGISPTTSNMILKLNGNSIVDSQGPDAGRETMTLTVSYAFKRGDYVQVFGGYWDDSRYNSLRIYKL